jgi:hypothetical protein
MPKVIRHTPVPIPMPTPTYDLMGLTETEARVLKALVGRMAWSSPGTGVFDALEKMLPRTDDKVVYSNYPTKEAPIYTVNLSV